MTVNPSKKTLIIVTGPTAGGKTSLSIDLAEHFGAEIISADSRQIYRGIEIITAAPTPDERRRVRHHLTDFLDLDQYYSAALFEQDVNRLLPQLWHDSDYAVMAGGSMMYIDAAVHGFDELPTVSDTIRSRVLQIYNDGGLEAVTDMLRRFDPAYLSRVDLKNPRRVIHAVEISLEAGVPYSSLLKGNKAQRPYNIVKLAIERPRAQLFDRINRRVDSMIENGAEEEARRVYHLRHLNSLNTVGFKELFAMFDGLMDRQTAISRMAKNTRVYAKKQMTWLARDTSLMRLDATSETSLTEQALNAINKAIS